LAQVVELNDQFVKGRKTRRGRPVPNDEKPTPEPVVTLVHPASIDDFLGARSYGERLRHLRRLRDEGLLIHGRRMLLQRVRGQGVERAYVFRCQAHEVPRIEARPAPREPGRVGRIKTY
jgi:hypothetical protein